MNLRSRVAHWDPLGIKRREEELRTIRARNARMIREGYENAWCRYRLRDVYDLLEFVHLNSGIGREIVSDVLLPLHRRWDELASIPLAEFPVRGGDLLCVSSRDDVNELQEFKRTFTIKGDQGVFNKLATPSMLQGRGLARRSVELVYRNHPEVTEWTTTVRTVDADLFWSRMVHEHGYRLDWAPEPYPVERDQRWMNSEFLSSYICADPDPELDIELEGSRIYQTVDALSTHALFREAMSRREEGRPLPVELQGNTVTGNLWDLLVVLDVRSNRSYRSPVKVHRIPMVPLELQAQLYPNVEQR